MILVPANIAEIAAAFICTVCLIIKPSVLNRWFVLFLWTTVVVELMGKLTSQNLMVKVPMYNLFNGVEFFFYLSLLTSIAIWKKSKIIFLLFIIGFSLFFLINLLFGQGLFIYNNHTHTAGSVLLIAGSLFILFKIFTSETYEPRPLRTPLIWILVALLIFYTGNLFNTAFYNYQSAVNPRLAVKLYRLINHNLNIVLYLLFNIAFVFEVRNTPQPE